MIRRLVPALTALAAVLLLAGCANPLHDETPGEDNGVATMTAPEALKAMAKAIGDRKDISFAGVQSLESLPNMPVWITYADGGSCEMVSKSAKGRMDLRLIGKQMFVRVDAPAALAIVKLDSGPAKAVANKWIARPADADLRRGCDLSAELLADKKFAKTLQAHEVTVVEKREVRRFTADSDDGPVTIFLPTSDLPLPVRITGRDKSGFFRLDVTGYDQGLVIAKPDPKEMLKR